jgi:hypothetical protein
MVIFGFKFKPSLSGEMRVDLRATWPREFLRGSWPGILRYHWNVDIIWIAPCRANARIEYFVHSPPKHDIWYPFHVFHEFWRNVKNLHLFLTGKIHLSCPLLLIFNQIASRRWNWPRITVITHKRLIMRVWKQSKRPQFEVETDILAEWWTHALLRPNICGLSYDFCIWITPFVLFLDPLLVQIAPTWSFHSICSHVDLFRPFLLISLEFCCFDCNIAP